MKRVLRKHPIKMLLLLAVLLYVGSYLVLSRRGMADMEKYHLAGFFYVPTEKAFESEDWEQAHYRLAWLYRPLNSIDCELGTGRGHCRCILRGLSK
jgi:hypothetical protein